MDPIIDRCTEAGCPYLAGHDGPHKSDPATKILRRVTTVSHLTSADGKVTSYNSSVVYCQGCLDRQPADYLQPVSHDTHLNYERTVSEPLDTTQDADRWAQCNGRCYANHGNQYHAERVWEHGHDEQGNPRYGVGESWEYNGRDDSDFYQVAFTPATGKLERICIGTTRAYAPAIDLTPLPAEHVAACEVVLAARYLAIAVSQEKRRINEPSPEQAIAHCKTGGLVVLTADCRHKARVTAEVDCYKCQGKGYWQNPRNAADKRPCFGCQGTGKRKASQAAEKGTPMITRPAGLVCKALSKVENRSKYGTWSYGTRLELEPVDGSGRFYAAANKVKLHNVPEPTEADLADGCKRLAAGCNAYPLFRTAGISLV